MNTPKLISWILFIVLALIWGSSFILMKISAEHLNGWEIAAVRIFAAAVIFLPLSVFHVRYIPKGKIPVVILTGILGNLFPAFLFAIAIQHRINSSVAGILNSLTPIFVLLIGNLFFHLHVRRKQVAGVMLGFAGLFILSISKGPVNVEDIGMTSLILLATVLYGVNVNVVSTHLRGIDPFKMATVSIGFLAFPTGVLIWQQGILQQVNDAGVLHSIMMAALLGVLGSAVATALFYMLIRKAGGLFASLVTYAVPIVAIMWGIWAHEDVGALQFSCLALILGGVYLANR